MTRRRTVRRAAVLVLASLLVAGCASMRPGPPTPITSMSDIAGKWRGTITRGFSGPIEMYFLTIDPDGSLTAQWGMNWQWGKVTLNSGVATFEMTDTSSGTLEYSAGPKGRSITMTNTFGGWSVYVTPM